MGHLVELAEQANIVYGLKALGGIRIGPGLASSQTLATEQWSCPCCVTPAHIISTGIRSFTGRDGALDMVWNSGSASIQGKIYAQQFMYDQFMYILWTPCIDCMLARVGLPSFHGRCVKMRSVERFSLAALTLTADKVM